MLKTLIAILLMFISCSVVAEPLTQDEKQTELIVGLTLLGDMAQTLDIKRHPGIYEANKILGKHPSDAKIVTYFATVGVLHYELVKALPSRWRPEAQVGVILFEVLVMVHDKQGGVSFKF